MQNTTKFWLISAAFLVLLGCFICGGVLSMLKWDFTKLSTVKYETNDYQMNEDFSAIRITADTADIIFVPSENSTVSCYEQKNAKHSVAVKDNTLVIEIVDTRKWYEYIGITWGTPKITLYIPQGEYSALSVSSSTGDITIPKEYNFESIDIAESTGDVTAYASAEKSIKIKTSTGKIHLKNVSASVFDLSVSTGNITLSDVVCSGDIQLRVSTGKANLTNITCQNLISDGDTGDIFLKNVIAAEKVSIERSTGDVTFDSSDAAEIFVETDTGDVTGTLLSDKVFIALSDTGKVNVPKTTTGGRCEISTDTGSIKLGYK